MQASAQAGAPFRGLSRRVGRCGLRSEGLSQIDLKFDPFDLALTRLDPESLDALPLVLSERLEEMRARLAEIKHIGEGARDYISVAKQWALRHIECQLEAEVAYLAALLSAAPDLVSDERDPRPRKSKAH